MIKRLQIKFVAINMVMVTAMLCVIFGLVYSFTRANLETQSISMMKSIAANPFQLGQPDQQSPDLKLPFFTLQLGLRGELVSTGGGYYDLSDQEFLRDLIAESVGSHRETGVVEEHDLRFCRVTSPVGTVLVFSDMSSERNTLNGLLKNCVIIGIFSFMAFLAISVFLSRWAVKPVAEAWVRQKQFVADASHELKTPLTVIMTNADMLQSEEYDHEQRKSLSAGIVFMSGQMKMLVEKLLELARSDADRSSSQLKPVELSKLVLDMAISFEGVFADEGLTLESRVEPGITVLGARESLSQVVDILLDNARKYSFPGGETTLELRSLSHGKCELRVSDPGPEIPPDELKRIFQRFYRMDKARSRDGSFGLGLSIAQSIVDQHRGRIWAESADGVNTFIVELKRRESP